MEAIALRRGETTPSVIEKPRPEPGDGEALVRILRVGIDGTDHEVVAGKHGSFPDGEDHLVLGHEAVGVVEEPNGTGLDRGQVVAPTVRQQPAGGRSAHFDRGEPDMAPPGEALERGIDGAHGFMAEYVAAPAECLVPVPESLAPVGFLVEPLSITEKALDLAYASRSAFEWEPEVALVLGNGSLGLLTLATLDGYDRAYCLGRRDRTDPTVELVERLGATYVDSRETSVDEIAAVHEPADLVYEATGHARHAFDGVRALAPNGVLALLGVPDSWTFEVDGGSLHRDIVLHNKAVVGSVNSGRRHFEAAVDALAGRSDGFLDDFLTGVYAPDECERAFATDETTIKAAVQFDTL